MLFLSQRLTNLWVKGTVPLFNYGQTGEELTTIGSARFITRPGTSDRHIIWEVWRNHDYDDEVMSIQPNDTVVDLGAHIGTFTVLAAQRARKGKVYSFEPMSANFQQLQRNIALNKLTNVQVFQHAVSDRKKKVKLYFGGPNLGGNSIYKKIYTDHFEEIRCDTLESIITQHRLKRINFLKIDTEGSEYDILLTAPNAVWSKIDKIALEFHDNMGNAHRVQELVDVLQRHGFVVKYKTSWLLRTLLRFGTLVAYKPATH